MRALLAALLVTCLTASSSHAAGHQPSARALRWAKTAGEVTGFTAGVVVTTALGLSKKWSKRTGETRTFDNGRPFPLEVRHTPIMGPRILRQAEALRGRSAGSRLLRSFLLGSAEGATIAPPSVANFEAFVTDALIDHHTRRR